MKVFRHPYSWFYILCFLLFHPSTASELEGQHHHISQKILYTAEDASEVYMVWGVDNWNTVPAEFLSGETTISEDRLYTLMQPNDDTFTATIKVKDGQWVDAMFWISKSGNGNIADRWDTNSGKYYGFHASGDPIQFKNNVKPPPGKLQKIIRSKLVYTIGSLVILTLVFRQLIRKYKFPKITNSSIIVALALAAYAVHVYLRWRLLGPESGFQGVLRASFQDWQLTFITAAAFVLINLIFKMPGRLIVYLAGAVFGISVIIAILNMQVIQVLGRPFSYQWLYYSDFLGSKEARTAISDNLSLYTFLWQTGVLVVFFLLSLLAVQLLIFYSKIEISKLFKTSFLVLIILMPAIAAVVSTRKVKSELRANPILYFANSFVNDIPESSLFTMNVPTAKLASAKHQYPLKSTPVKNIILIVLESTGASYLDIYGGKFGISPNLNKAASSALIIENMYAHAPATNKAMVSLLCSIYPWISYNTITQESPELSQPSLASELANAGFRTSFLTSSDLSFQNSKKFVDARDFGTVAHFEDIQCDKLFKMEGMGEGYGVGIDDSCLPGTLLNWIDLSPGQPFFSVLWTNQAHYPYFFSGKEKDFGVNNIRFNRYLNILSHYDQMIGTLIDSLESRQLLDSTLIAVVGDHGEAFGQHDQYGHGNHIYEENVRVPMMLINPILFNGTRKKTVAGHIDVAPTLLSLAGIESPATWQGESLLNERRTNRAFFFAPWSDYLFGARIGNTKVIFNETNQEVLMFDMASDPKEQNNISNEESDLIPEFRKEVAGWIQSHNTLMQQKLTRSDNTN